MPDMKKTSWSTEIYFEIETDDKAKAEEISEALGKVLSRAMSTVNTVKREDGTYYSIIERPFPEVKVMLRTKLKEFCSGEKEGGE